MVLDLMVKLSLLKAVKHLKDQVRRRERHIGFAKMGRHDIRLDDKAGPAQGREAPQRPGKTEGKETSARCRSQDGDT